MRTFAASLALLAALVPVACTDTAGEAAGADAASDGSTVQVPEDGGAASDAQDGSVAVSATLRIANLSPDLGAVDVCVRTASSSSWDGPLFAPAGPAPDAGASDASASGVSTGSVSAYVKANGSGTFDIALVAAGDLSCGRPLALGQVTLDAGKWVTVVVMGVATADAGSASALRLSAFADDPTRDPALARVRFINAALPSDALRASIASGAQTTDIAAAIPPGHAASQSDSPPKVDALGYGSTPPAADPASLTLTSASAPAWSSAAATLGIVARSVHTAIVFPQAIDGGTTPAVAWCDDVGGGCIVLR